MSDRADLKTVVRSYLALLEQGGAPDPETFADRHAEGGEPLRRLLRRMAELDPAQAAAQLDELVEAALVESAATLRADGSATPAPAKAAAAGSGEDLYDGRYKILRTLGTGGFGRVLLVTDTLDPKTPLALKTILAEHESDQEFERRFRNEIRVLRNLAHPGIPQIFNDGRTPDGEFYYTMAFVEGKTLDAIVREEAPLDPARVVRFVRQLLDVLDYAHAKGVVHRDLKPLNVMVVDAGTDEESLRVLDFGIAKILAREGTSFEDALTVNTGGGPIGSPHYMAPEQVRGQDVDPRTDLYALGIVLYQMVSGKLPFSGKTAMEIATARLEKEPTPLAERTAGMPDSLAQLVMQLLQRDKEDRPSAQQVLDRLDGLSAGQASIRRRLGWVAAAVVVLFASVAFLVFRPRQVGTDPSGGPRGGAGGPVDRDRVDRGRSEALGPPELDLREPAADALLATSSVRLRGSIANAPDHLFLGDRRLELGADGSFDMEVELEEGPNELRFRAATPGVEELVDVGVRSVVVDTTAPELREWGVDGGIPDADGRWVVGARSARVTGAVVDPAPGRVAAVEVEGWSAVEVADGSFAVAATFAADGPVERVLRARDEAGNGLEATLAFLVDTSPPSLELDGALDRTVAHDAAVVAVSGRAVDATLTEVTVAGERVSVDAAGTFAHEVAWRPEIEVSARDRAGHASAALVVRATRLPPPPAIVEVRAPLDGEVLAPGLAIIRVAGEVSAGTTAVLVNGARADLDGTRFAADVRLVEGANRLELVARDAHGQTSATRLLTVTRPDLAVPAGFEALGAEVDGAGRPTRLLHPGTGVELVLVPAGGAIARPFWIGRYEVTCAQFEAWCRSVGRAVPERPAAAGDTHPVSGVTFDDAAAFCGANGFRLPTRREWRLAAGGAEGRPYPWGADWSPGQAQVEGEGAAPVGSHAADVSASCGALDLAGNVSEWCSHEVRGEPVLCGGNWFGGADLARVDAEPTMYSKVASYVGLRVVLPDQE